MDLKHLQYLDYSAENIKKLISYIEDGIVPKFKSQREKDTYDKKYGNFIVKNGFLIYEPKNLVLIPPEARKQVMEQIYQQDIALGKSQNN
jgi:hypothetical protein